MSEKYCFKKMLELKKAFDEGSGAMFIIEQIARDQREACKKAVMELEEIDFSQELKWAETTEALDDFLHKTDVISALEAAEIKEAQ